ncbi:MAG: hypothetical protein ACLP9L_33620 [Thermoguttaceae bacterium]
MNKARSLKQKISKVHGLMAQRQYDTALRQVEELLVRWPGNSQLHILWATLVQLHDAPLHTLDDAKQALQTAAALDESSPSAPIELGHFLDAVEDNPHAASKAFSDGIRTARRLLIDALLGQARALLQLNKREEAIACLIESLYLTNLSSSANRRRSPRTVPGVLCQEPSGPTFRLPLTGAFGSEIEGLLADVLTGQPTG